MKIRERLKYFFSGMGSVLDLSGSYFSKPVLRRYDFSLSPPEVDAEAIAGDWKAIGKDLSSVLESN
ncbi:hypothetical protein KA107_01995 [Candidatus Pacearchaeota archaeon]|nr:hypothetical protein [Candidatus Pacearchaeota archaeon]